MVLDGKCDSNNHVHLHTNSTSFYHLHSSSMSPLPPSQQTPQKRHITTDTPDKRKQARTAEIDVATKGERGNSDESNTDNSKGNNNNFQQWWFFTWNPRVRDVGQIQLNAQLEWQVRQHFDKIRTGDRVYVWVSGKMPGIYATGTIIRNPYCSEHGGMHDRTQVRIDNVFPVISKESLEKDLDLRTHPVLRNSPGQINYQILPHLAEKLAKILVSRVPVASSFFSTFSSPQQILSSSFPTIPLSPPSLTAPLLSYSDPPSPPPSTTPVVVKLPSPTLSSPSSTPPLKPNGIHIVLKRSPPSTSPVQSPPLPISQSRNPISPTTHPQLLQSFASHFPNMGVYPHLIPTQLPQSLPFSPHSHTLSHPMVAQVVAPPRTCDVCKRTDASVSLQCVGCRDWFHPTCTTVHTGTLSLLPWYCPPCATLNAQGQKCTACVFITKNTLIAPPALFLVCDWCSEGFHSSCVSNSPAALVRCWLCTNCFPSTQERVNAKLLVGWRELRVECWRMLVCECERIYELHRKSMLS